MEQNAKQLLKKISEAVSNLTDKQISLVAHAPKENEWRAYIWQRTPWEDIAWRVKEPNANGEAEVHLGFYSSKPGEGFSEGLDNAEQLAKGKVSHIVKNENGIRFVWKVNLNDTKGLKKVEDTILELLPEFISLALSCVVKTQTEKQENNLNDEYQMKPTEGFFEWIENMKNTNLINTENPSAIYQNICKNLTDLLNSGFIDSGYYDHFEEILKDNFYKELSVFKSGLEKWYSSLSSEMVSDLESESYVEDYDFAENLEKIWHIFLYWGAMYTGNDHPKYPNFITHFDDIEVQQTGLKILIESVPIPSKF